MSLPKRLPKRMYAVEATGPLRWAERRTRRYTSYQEFIKAVVRLYQQDRLGAIAMSTPIEWTAHTVDDIEAVMEALNE